MRHKTARVETRKVFNRHLKRDIVLILISVVVSVAITKSGLLSEALLMSVESKFIAAFIAGVFFTNIYMTPLSIALFLSLATDMSLFLLVAVGTLGAIAGDLLTFTLIRHTFRDDVEYLLTKKRALHQLAAALHKRTFRWLIPFFGALLIVIPIIPDEVGLTVMGVSRMSVLTLTFVSLTMNALSIAFLWFIA